MLKYIAYVIIAAVVAGLIGGGIHLWRVARKNQKEMAAYSGEEIAVNKDFGRVLIVYYSLTGHTQEIAKQIQQKIGGDMYEIKTKKKLNTTPWYYLTLRHQLNTGNYPELSGSLPDFSKYDTIFIGAPVWWYTIATPMLSFLKQADFQNKKVIPFSTQGSNYGAFFKDFAIKAKNAQLGEGASFNNLPDKYNNQVSNKISVWLNQL